MTRMFDLSAASQPPLFDVGCVNIHGLSVCQCAVSTIRRAIVTGHYSGVMPDAVQEAFVATDGANVVAAVAYGPGANQSTMSAVMAGADNTTARELVRLWVHDSAPRNTASFVVSRTLKLLPDCVSLVVSFADSSRHCGYVYQALNFRYIGMSLAGVRYVDAHGVEVTARLANVYRMRHPDRFEGKSLSEIRHDLGWTSVPSPQKHRYALGIGRNARSVNRHLDSIALPYPKEARRDEA